MLSPMLMKRRTTMTTMVMILMVRMEDVKVVKAVKVGLPLSEVEHSLVGVEWV